LSRLQYKETHDELLINDYLRDDTLLRITHADRWYADIVNFIVKGYVPPGTNKRKLLHDSRSTFGMSHIFFESALMDYCEGVFLWLRLLKLWKDAMPRHMEDTMEHFGHMLNFGKVAFSRQRCMKIQRTLLGDATDVKNMGISTHEMKCLSQIIFK